MRILGAALWLVAATALADSPPPGDRAYVLAISGGRTASAAPLHAVKGETVVITLLSDAPGEAHLHGYRLAAALAPGKAVHWRFTAHASGRFRIEWHAHGESSEPHHRQPLAILEVLPR
jgi:hypothetical protein